MERTQSWISVVLRRYDVVTQHAHPSLWMELHTPARKCESATAPRCAWVRRRKMAVFLVY